MQKKVRVPTEIETFEITTLDGVEQMAKLFGSTFGIGLRKPFLSICKRKNQLQSGDTVNILDVAHEGNGMNTLTSSCCAIQSEASPSNGPSIGN